ATGVEATFGQLAIDNVLVRALKGADGVRATGATLTVQQSTVVGEKGAANGVVSSVPSAGLGACPEASVTVRNSIVWGFKTALARTTSPGTCIGSPRANLDVAWSALEVKI